MIEQRLRREVAIWKGQLGFMLGEQLILYEGLGSTTKTKEDAYMTFIGIEKAYFGVTAEPLCRCLDKEDGFDVYGLVIREMYGRPMTRVRFLGREIGNFSVDVRSYQHLLFFLCNNYG